MKSVQPMLARSDALVAKVVKEGKAHTIVTQNIVLIHSMCLWHNFSGDIEKYKNVMILHIVKLKSPVMFFKKVN